MLPLLLIACGGEEAEPVELPLDSPQPFVPPGAAAPPPPSQGAPAPTPDACEGLSFEGTCTGSVASWCEGG